MAPTAEQQALIDHAREQPLENARVVAGPGTGKSWTTVKYLEELANSHPELRVRMLTFTRNATAEFAEKLVGADLGHLATAPPSTVHGFALGLLMRHPDQSGLPQPLRIADTWAQKRLIHPALRDRLKDAAPDVERITTSHVSKLETWMAAAWQSLDPDVALGDEIDQRVVDQFVGIWTEHRELFGYSLLSELPYQAGEMIADFGLEDFELDVLLIDEYQDLNRADIRLAEQVAAAGTAVVAIGDDDQSIYAHMRKAHPAGIRQFCEEFDPAADYPLSVSHRCPSAILDPATRLIDGDADRGNKLRLRPSNNGGTFAYLRFETDSEEANGVADIVAARVRDGVVPNDIAILARSSVDRWGRELVPVLAERGLQVASAEWVARTLLDDLVLRRALTLTALALDDRDSLAWWGFLSELTPGVGGGFIDYVLDQRNAQEAFANALLRLHADGFPDGPARTAALARTAVSDTLETVNSLDTTEAPDSDHGWGEWIRSLVNEEALTEDSHRLLEMVGAALPVDEGLASFLSQLEPTGKELARSEEGAVRLMSMSASKGLTVNTAITVGVEEGVVPLPVADLREERRLLYVAMTRATDWCILTWAQRREGATANLGRRHHGSRRRSPLLRNLPGINNTPGATFCADL